MPHPTARRRAVASWVVAAAVLTLLVSACAGGSGAVDTNANGQFRFVGVTPQGHTIPQGDRKTAGNASAPYLEGSKTFSLHSMAGKVVVLNYWAHWCGPCITETPGLERTYLATKAEGVVIVGVDVKDDKSPAVSFVKHAGLTYPIVFDDIAKTAIQIGRVPTLTLPSTVVIDRQGKVAAVYAGPVQQGDLQPVVTALAREK